jgi:GT2 family glycosyltransferase
MKPSPSWIVIPIYNNLALTRDAVASALAQDIPGGVRILAVIDRGDDGVAHWLRTQHPRVQTVEAPGCGVSKAWNLALGHVFDTLRLPHALVINNDVRLRPDTYRRLVDDGGLFVTCVGTSSGAKFPGGEPSGQKRPHPDFSCYCIRRECWERVGRFDDSMRIYVSDLDFHIRMHQAGIDAMCLDLPFFHYASGTLKHATEEDRERILKQAQIDRETFKTKWGVEGGSSEYYEMFGHSHP